MAEIRFSSEKELISEKIKEVVKIAKGKGQYKKIVSSTEKKNDAMQNLFWKNGFKTDYEIDGNEIIFYYELA